MYSTCLYCNKGLGANQVVEPFPVGRRLAFDQARGRLWVVCRSCERWNLSPLEERWEAIEECERRFRDARKRVASDNIGLARLNEGLELVRIGEPLRPEFAAWRYGDQFGRRRRRNLLVSGAVGGVGVGLVAAADITGVLSGASWGLWQGYQALILAAKKRRLVARVPMSDGERLVVRGRHAWKAELLMPEQNDDGTRLLLPHEAGIVLLTGHEARRAVARIMPRINASGGKPALVADAVRELEHAGGPTRFLSEASWIGVVSRSLVPKRPAAGPEFESKELPKLDQTTRLAIEMAVNEENERAALEGELALLELEWRDAEEIAAIADRLLIPEQVERQLEELKGRLGERPADG